VLVSEDKMTILYTNECWY